MMKELNRGAMYRMQPPEEKKQKAVKQPDEAIRLKPIYEHQFYADFFEFQQLNEEIKQMQLDFEKIP